MPIPITLTINKEVESREELDTFVRNHFGEDAEKNRAYVLEATDAQLQKLGLGKGSSVHGVRVQVKK